MGRKLLAFDVGNSRIKIALFDDGELILRESVALSNLGDCEQILAERFELDGAPDNTLIASVVRGAGESICAAVQSVWAITPRVIDTQMDLGIDFAVARPDHVGIDRLLEASEAFQIVQGAVVVAAFGSAITVDLVSSEGVFQGGTIAPGLQLGSKALHVETSLLPQVELEPPASAIGTDTVACILSGIVYGAAGAVDRLFDEFVAGGEATLVLTGGDAALMSDYIQKPHRIEEDLVLRALVSQDQRECT